MFVILIDMSIFYVVGVISVMFIDVVVFLSYLFEGKLLFVMLLVKMKEIN